MLKVAVIVLVVLVVVLGLPLGLPMASMCPDCDLGTTSVVCVALLASIVLLVPRRAIGILVVAARRPLLVTTDPLERPPRSL